MKSLILGRAWIVLGIVWVVMGQLKGGSFAGLWFYWMVAIACVVLGFLIVKD